MNDISQELIVQLNKTIEDMRKEAAVLMEQNKALSERYTESLQLIANLNETIEYLKRKL